MPRRPFRFPPPAEWPLVPVVAVLSLVLCVTMVAIRWQRILSFQFYDPDDALRYVEARDFAAGQNWFDVSQHRINPPIGGPIHWSRIVDLPIAAIMLILRPLLGPAIADQIALAVVPMVLLCALCFVVALAVRRLSGTAPAIVATMMIGVSLPILNQFRPIRVDHHGWQILMAAVALWASFDPNGRRGGVIAGLAVAFWAHISSEGLPYAALFGGACAIAFLRDRAAWSRFLAYVLTFAGGSALLLIGTRGWPEATVPYCDAVSPVYLIPIIVVALVLPSLHWFLGSKSWASRFITSALSATAGGALYMLVGGACRAGPFGQLDPLVYKEWYLHINEGRPVWEQDPLMAAIVILPPLVGLAGILWAILRERSPDRRFRWFQMLFLFVGAYGVSLFVLRAISTSYVMALPGIAIIICTLWPKVRGLGTAPGRIVATLALYAITPLGLSAIAAVVLPDDAEPGSSAEARLSCLTRSGLTGLAALPRGTILAPLDEGPVILAFTHHNVVATGHHRNNLAMRDVILTFTGSATQARRLMERHGVSYVAYCPDNENDHYVKLGPKGFMHMLEAGTPPNWLHPVPMRAGETIKVYRVSYDTQR